MVSIEDGEPLATQIQEHVYKSTSIVCPMRR